MYTLYPHQEEAVDAGESIIEDKKNEIIVGPTGSGKSLIVAGIANRRRNSSFLVLQPNVDILEQNYTKLYNFGHRDIAIYSASAGIKKIDQVTFATIGSIINCLDLFKNVEAIIADECHLVNPDPKKGQLSKLITYLDKPVVGLTASPYTMTSSFGGELVEAKFLHRRRPKVFSGIRHITQNRFLHDEGYLCKVKYIENDEYDTAKVKLNTTGMDFDQASLAKYHRDIDLPVKAAETICEGLGNGVKKYIGFSKNVAESKRTVEILVASGIKAVHVDAKTKKRGDILEALRTGEIQAIMNCGVFTTGVDVPDLDGVALACPDMSLPLFYQKVGRGVRRDDNKDFLTVNDLCGNINRFGHPDKYEIDEEKKGMHRLRCGTKYLTNVNFVTGSESKKDIATLATGHSVKNKKEAKITASPDQIKLERMPFGKYSGKKLMELPDEYLDWCVKNFNSGTMKTKLRMERDRRLSEAS